MENLQYNEKMTRLSHLVRKGWFEMVDVGDDKTKDENGKVPFIKIEITELGKRQCNTINKIYKELFYNEDGTNDKGFEQYLEKYYEDFIDKQIKEYDDNTKISLTRVNKMEIDVDKDDIIDLIKREWIILNEKNEIIVTKFGKHETDRIQAETKEKYCDENGDIIPEKRKEWEKLSKQAMEFAGLYKEQEEITNKITSTYLNDINIDFNHTANSTSKLKEQMSEEGEEMIKKWEEYVGDGKSHDVHYRLNMIPDIDRLRNYQLMCKYLNTKIEMKRSDGIDFDEEKINAYHKLFTHMIDHAKVFTIDNSLIPLFLNDDCDYRLMPYGSIAVDCRFSLGDREYFGFFLHEIENNGIKDIIVVSIFATLEQISDEDEETESKLITNIFSLSEVGDKKEILISKEMQKKYHFNPKEEEKYRVKLKKFISSFLSYINEKDIHIIEHEANPKNNHRRKEKGRMELPEYRVVAVKGSLKLYVDNFNKSYHSGSGGKVTHRYDVMGHWVHFVNEERYNRLYKIPLNRLAEQGYSIKDGIIRRWRKPHERGEGAKLKTIHEVKK